MKGKTVTRHARKPPSSTLPVEQEAERRPHRIDMAKAWKLRVVNRLSFSEIADTLRCSKSTVHAALERLNGLLPDPELVQAYEGVEPYILTAAKEQLLASLMDPEAIEKASLNNRAFAFSQVANHERLVKGHSTSNVSIIERLIEQSHEEVFKPQRPRSGQAADVEPQACIDISPSASVSSETERDGEA